MQKHESNALHLAHVLERHPAVEAVYYPGLPDHPLHRLAAKQMTGFGGMISFEVKGGLPAAEHVASKLKLFILAESLGGVESLICHPPQMTHGSLSAGEREKRGIRDSLLRLSVGIEDVSDLEADLIHALETL